MIDRLRQRRRDRQDFDRYRRWLIEVAVPHAERFRKVSTRYPRRVTEAYDGDLERAMRDSDGEVAATVAAWEREQGIEPRDWHAIGAIERTDDEEPPSV
jgi:hypothetical protein